MITVVNYGMGNIRSIINALDYLNIKSRVVSSPQDILGSDSLILPGVGSFFIAMQNLHSLNLIDSLNEAVLVNKRPVLGICLGMQLLAEIGTEDGNVRGLGWIPGYVKRFDFEKASYRIPHTGFNSVSFVAPKSSLFNYLGNQEDFYFVHSYHVECDSEYVSGYVDYHGKFVASIERENIYGTQFHPEKSQSNGLMVLRNFSNLTKNA